jgi:hypothetical protein
LTQNLETTKLEIEDFLAKHSFVVFHGRPREFDPSMIDWDTENHPDFRGFLETATRLGAPVILFSHRRFSEEMLEDAEESLELADLQFEEKRTLEKRLKEFRLYTGFTGAIELSFQHQSSVYRFEQRTEWFDEVMDLMDDIHSALEDYESPGDDSSFGGFYSRN